LADPGMKPRFRNKMSKSEVITDMMLEEYARRFGPRAPVTDEAKKAASLTHYPEDLGGVGPTEEEELAELMRDLTENEAKIAAYATRPTPAAPYKCRCCVCGGELDE
jgi:hypothetical protein